MSQTTRQLLLISCLLSLFSSTSCEKSEEALRPVDEVLIDHLIQNVCVDANDLPTNENPATCSSQRDIKPGEAVPYLRTDFGPAGARYQAVTSYPMTGVDGKTKVLVAKHFAPSFAPQSYQYDFLMSRDGFDLIELESDYISISRTSDGGCLDQRMSKNGWVLFSSDGLSGQAELPITITRLVAKDGCATTSSGIAYTLWSQQTITFTSGYAHDSKISSHYAAKNLSQKNNALEKFYFTKEFGFTRWEAWIPHLRCLDELANGTRTAAECDGTFTDQRCNAEVHATMGGQAWVRVDCRDSTNYQSVDTPFFPYQDSMAADQIQY